MLFALVTAAALAAQPAPAKAPDPHAGHAQHGTMDHGTKKDDSDCKMDCCKGKKMDCCAEMKKDGTAKEHAGH